MSKRLKLAIVLAAFVGGFLATAGSFAYAQSTTQQSNQATCGSMNSSRGMGVMGGMNHSTRNQEQCRSSMGESKMGRCQDFTASGTSTRPYGMMYGLNTARACH